MATALQRTRGMLTCKVCKHESVGTINVALARGAAAAMIAAKFGISRDSVYRHFHRHLSGPVLDRLRVRSLTTIVGKNLSLPEIVANENQTLLAQIIALKASILTSVQAAEIAGEGRLVSSLIGRLTKLLELESRILGQVTTGSVTINNNYLSSESFVRARTAIVSALRPFPQAAVAVSRALLQIETDVVDVESTDIESGASAEVAVLPVPVAEAGVAAPSTVCLEQQVSSANISK